LFELIADFHGVRSKKNAAWLPGRLHAAIDWFGLAIGRRAVVKRQPNAMNQLLLFGSGFLGVLEARVGSCRELVLEFFDSARRVDELQFAGVERVAHVADVDFQLFSGASRGEAVAATAADLRFEILWMDTVFHGRSQCVVGVGQDTTRISPRL
jgi:hypothetical protein